MIKLKKIMFEMPHVEYLDGSIVDFQIEKYKMPMELKVRLLKAFKEQGVVGYSTQQNKWLYLSTGERRVATQEEQSTLEKLPLNWEDYLVKF